MTADCVVVGAGLAGLAAAVHVAGTGRRVVVLERNHEPGGCATTYARGRYTFEASLHLLDAVGPGEPNRAVLDALGVRLDLIRPDPLRREVWPALGVDLEIPQGRAAALEALSAAFPADRDGLCALFDLAARVHAVGYARFARDTPAFADARAAAALAGVSARALLDRHLSDPRAKAVVGSQAHYVGVGAGALGAVPFLVLLHGYVGCGGWAVRGGSRSLTEALVASLRARGGELWCGADVTAIATSDRRVRGVTTADGRHVDTRVVVSAIAPPVLFERLLPPGSAPTGLSERRVGPSFARLSVGIDHPPPPVPYETGADGCAITVPTVVDAGWSPPGTAVVTCTIPVPASTDRWTPDHAAAVRAELLGRIDRWVWPGVGAHVEEVDLAQPATFARYLGSPGGAVLGWALGPSDRLPGARTAVDGLFLAGGWTFPGPGQTAALISGTLAAREVTRGAV